MAFGQRSRPASRTAGRDLPDDADERDLGPEADPEQVARRICLALLEFRPRTRAELAAELSDRGVPDDAAQAVLERFTDVGLIDDAAFAQMWVTGRHRGKGLSSRALQQELRRKGVDDEVAREAVEALDPALERATARALVDRKLPSTRGLDPQARTRRLAGLLARKGYPAGTAYSVVREALAEEGVELHLDTDGLSALD